MTQPQLTENTTLSSLGSGSVLFAVNPYTPENILNKTNNRNNDNDDNNNSLLMDLRGVDEPLSAC